MLQFSTRAEVSVGKSVYIGMSADILHHGHINIIQHAAALGNVTIGLLTDRAVATYKRLPFLNYEQRKKILSEIKGVRTITPQEEWDYVPNLRRLKPDIMVHGDDWRTGAQKHFRDRAYEAMAEWGGQIVEIPYTRDVSSTELEEAVRALGVSPTSRMKSLSRLIAAKDFVRIIEVHDGITGLIAEKCFEEKDGRTVSFDGMWSSSLTDSVSRGKPDIETVDVSSRLRTINEIFEVTSKPLIFDGDTGGRVEHFPYTVRSLERTGVSAVVIEDKTGLKKNSLFGNEVRQEQKSIGEFCALIESGRENKINREFMVIARIESLILEKGMDDALKRAHAYIEAGADGIMIHSRQKRPDEIFMFCESYQNIPGRPPLIAVPTSYNTTTESELRSHGINVVIYANHLLRSAYPAMMETARRILKNGRSSECDDICLPIKDILELIPGTR